MKLYWNQVGFYPKDWCPYRKGEICTCTHMHTQYSVKMKAEAGVTHPQIKNCKRLPANHQKVRGMKHFTHRPQKGPTLHIPGSWISSFKNCEEWISVI